MLCERGLQAVEQGPAPFTPPTTLGAGAPATRPSQSAPPVEVARLVETPRTPPGAPRGLSHAILQAIADERAHCEGLTVREFAQRLYDKGIYRAKGEKVPAAGWVQRQLAKAREAGVTVLTEDEWLALVRPG